MLSSKRALLSIMADEREFLYSTKKLSKLKKEVHKLGKQLGWFENELATTINKLDEEIKARPSKNENSMSYVFDSDSTEGYNDSGISPLQSINKRNSFAYNLLESEQSQHHVSSMKDDVDIEKPCERTTSSSNNCHDFEQVHSSDDEDIEHELYRSLDDNLESNIASDNHDNNSFEGNVSNELYFSFSNGMDNEEEAKENHNSDQEDDEVHLNENSSNKSNRSTGIDSEKITDNVDQDTFEKKTQKSLSQDMQQYKELNVSLSDDDGVDDSQGASYNGDAPYKKSFDGTSPPAFTHKSLRERVLQKYNPENSNGSDSDDLDAFLDKIRTPKQPAWDDVPRQSQWKGVDDFIVDDDCFIEDDDDNNEVFVINDDSDDDKENFTTSQPTFKTPHPAPSVSCKTPLTGKRNKTSSTFADRPKRPQSSIDSIITPYSTQKEFKKGRETVVKELFQLYNSTIFENKLPSDFSITWNNKMRTTAGFCYYGKKSGIPTARIELADKVIDSAVRLRDTLVHEMCHAAAWLINGIRAGHGPVWKRWAQRANFVHHDLPPISRCHSYKINAKFTYLCTNEFCSNSIGRHSKSLDLEKYRCAYCHSRFELQPQLKKDGTPQSARTPNKFALYVKENYSKVKQTGMAHKDVMKELSSQFSSLSTK